MWITFKNYQEEAIDELRDKANGLLKKDGGKILVFKAPTGSGKTLMMAEWMMRFCDPYARTDGKTFAFVWIAVNKLHDQSHDTLKKFYEDKGMGLRCSYFQELEERRIRKNEILFLNWASINNEDKVIVRANERDNNLSAVIERTKDDGRTIFLIIDESHHTAKSENSMSLKKNIDPKLTIEVSATPQIADLDEKVTVDIEDVRAEEMIKKEIVINPGFEEYVIDTRKSDQTADELVLKAALQKRLALKKQLEKEGSDVNPLLLVQLPDTKQGMPDKREEVESLLGKYGYTRQSGRLAVYLSEKDNKVNLVNIEKNESDADVLIFKQAIALGWDCPRAAILVLFRQWRDETMTFSIQTLGRIMRMPEHKHYTDDELNIAYLFTSLPDINTRIIEGASSGIRPLTSYRRKEYQDIDLVSYHAKRFREETRLSADFLPIFLAAGKDQHLPKTVSFKAVQTKVMKDVSVKNPDVAIGNIQAPTFTIPKTEGELQFAFDMFVRDNLGDFAPETRSIKRINDSIYSVFGARRDEDQWPVIQAAVLSDNALKQKVINTINQALELYKVKVGKGKKAVIQNDNPWNAPKAMNYEKFFARKEYKKSVTLPYYAKTKGTNNLSLFEEDSAVEVAFIEYLEKAKQVKWWLKNGKQDGSFFAVPYHENEQEKLFYVDFVVLLDDGRLGLFDTKGGIFAKTANERAEGLAEYIATENKKGKKLFGGIVIKDKNSWRYNDSKKYAYDPKNLKEWKFLDLN